MKKHILKCLILLLLALNARPSGAQNVHQIMDSLNHRTWYYADWNDGWGGLLEGWVYQNLLHHMASERQLVAIVKVRQGSAPLRLTAMRALMDRRLPVCKALVLNNMTDSSYTTVRSYDVIYSDYTQNMYVEWLMERRRGGWVSVADSLEIDSVLLATPAAGRFAYTRRLLLRGDLRPENESRIRQMYVDEHVAEALPMLARYQRVADKPLIISALSQYAMGLDKEGARKSAEGHTNEALLAVRNWPNEDFKRPLLTIRNYEVKRHYYDYARIKYLFEALMAYDSPWAYRQIDLTLRMAKGNRYYREFFHSAMKKHYNARYRPLLDKWPYKPWNDFGDGFE
ncbi:hypothetical protein [Prevotella sp.]|uniref:hypothetical protein n=1 Tax=Prevotella sp. TaxID=59823 RepID=UPI002F946222